MDSYYQRLAQLVSLKSIDLISGGTIAVVYSNVADMIECYLSCDVIITTADPSNKEGS